MYLRDPLKHTKKRIGVRICAHLHTLFIPFSSNLDKFGQIWTNLDETLLVYSCRIEILVLNDERLKK